MTDLTLSTLPIVGAELDGGVFAGLTSEKDGAHAAVVLLTDKTAEPYVSWTDAQSFASAAGGQLPSRTTAALVAANLQGHVRQDWYWTARQNAASFARDADFGHGYQDFSQPEARAAVMVVKLVPLVG